MGFIDVIKERAKSNIKTIVLPETEDMRTLEAADKILKEGIAKLVLVGNEEAVKKSAAEGGFDISGAQIVDPATSEKTQGYIDKLVELRQKKGMTPEQAKEMAAFSDGAIVGSAIVRIVAEHGTDCVPYVKEYVKKMKAAVAEA